MANANNPNFTFHPTLNTPGTVIARPAHVSTSNIASLNQQPTATYVPQLYATTQLYDGVNAIAPSVISPYQTIIYQHPTHTPLKSDHYPILQQTPPLSVLNNGPQRIDHVENDLIKPSTTGLLPHITFTPAGLLGTSSSSSKSVIPNIISELHTPHVENNKLPVVPVSRSVCLSSNAQTTIKLLNQPSSVTSHMLPAFDDQPPTNQHSNGQFSIIQLLSTASSLPVNSAQQHGAIFTSNTSAIPSSYVHTNKTVSTAKVSTTSSVKNGGGRNRYNTKKSMGDTLVTHVVDLSESMSTTSPTIIEPTTSNVVEEQPLYVNAKQYHRILKRRIARAKLEAEGKVPKERRRYLHESRHKHAMNRVRDETGKFF